VRVYEEESAAAERSHWAQRESTKQAEGCKPTPSPRGKTLGDLAIENREHKLKAKDFTRTT
jgi:hypothetical protein